MLHEVMLYHPLRDEVHEDQVETLFEEKHGEERKVQLVKMQVMEFLEDIQEARYMMDQLKRELELDLVKEAGKMLDPAGELDNEECQEEGSEENEAYEFCNPEELIGISEPDNNPPQTYRKLELIDKKLLREKTQTLDENQREVINIVVKYSKDVVKSRRNGDPLPSAPLLMVHGGAGAGKSTVIAVLEQWAQRILQREGDNIDQLCIIKTAFTGCAASNIRGQTLHQALGFSFGDKHYSLSEKVRDK